MKYKPLFVFALFIAILGWIETRPEVLHFLDTQDPITVFLLWYAVLASFVFGIGKILFPKHTKHKRVLAVMIIYFAIGIVNYWPASSYVNQVTNKPASSILNASEDGIVYSFFDKMGLPSAINVIATYVVTPVVLIAVAFYMMTPATFKKALEAIYT